MDISELREWLDQVDAHLDHQQQQIAVEILKEIRTRLDFLLEVGLDYLALNRQSASLSGGESQRIRLATQIGSQSATTNASSAPSRNCAIWAIQSSSSSTMRT